MNFNEAELAALKSGMQRIGIFVRIATDPIVYIWLGAGDIKPGVNVLDTTGVTYSGLGAIANVPSVKQLMSGAAERVDFVISGVSGDVLTIATGNDADDVKGSRVDVGFAIMAADWKLLGPVRWNANYEADYLAVEQEAADPSQPIVRTIRLSCGSRMTGRKRPAYSYFTNQDQQSRYPGDLFCQYTTVYAAGFEKPWPTF